MEKIIMNNIIKLTKRVFISFALVVMIYTLSIAEEKQKLIGFVNDTAKQVISVIESTSADSQKEQELRDIFCNSVDIDWMARFALGKYYKEINQQQLNEYLVAYKNFLINTYVSKFSEYNGVNFDIESVKYISSSQYIVSTKILNKKYTSKYISVAYRIKMINNHFLIRDIIAEDISLILGQRADFNSIISKEGIQALIEKLGEKLNRE
ncbi:MlaC/ttg2D family ABC transporter substrate-binding protein [Candidatus Bandiella numerosa]|uniref:MlaC/ttg2D family ABC transporter substrate-binding protein n=1 Tax=Candidatus Bandiella numerosa TaxID=2570586 RepID=UPI001F4119CE|nr:ABC transporter substrate-binding protein [Candidatus Bandiella numerosa]